MLMSNNLTEIELINKNEKADEEIKIWSDTIAAIIVDAVIDAKYVKPENFEEVVSIVSMEIYVRLAIGDYPPPYKPKQ